MTDSDFLLKGTSSIEFGVIINREWAVDVGKNTFQIRIRNVEYCDGM